MNKSGERQPSHYSEQSQHHGSDMGTPCAVKRFSTATRIFRLDHASWLHPWRSRASGAAKLCQPRLPIRLRCWRAVTGCPCAMVFAPRKHEPWSVYDCVSAGSAVQDDRKFSASAPTGAIRRQPQSRGGKKGRSNFNVLFKNKNLNLKNGGATGIRTLGTL